MAARDASPTSNTPNFQSGNCQGGCDWAVHSEAREGGSASAHHDRGAPVAQHVAAHVQEAAAEVVAVGAQLRQLARAAVAAVLAAQQPDGAQDLLRRRRRQAGRI